MHTYLSYFLYVWLQRHLHSFTREIALFLWSVAFWFRFDLWHVLHWIRLRSEWNGHCMYLLRSALPFRLRICLPLHENLPSKDSTIGTYLHYAMAANFEFYGKVFLCLLLTEPPDFRQSYQTFVYFRCRARKKPLLSTLTIFDQPLD